MENRKLKKDREKENNHEWTKKIMKHFQNCNTFLYFMSL